jgi:hypothetical protein
MSVDNKPDPPLNDMTWAESGPNPIQGSQLPTEPQQQLKQAGYGLQLPLPHAQFNWLIRSIMRWIRWLVSKVDNHVHDGQGNPDSAPKINLKQHVDWGPGGELQVTSNGPVLHEISHQGIAGTKRIITGQLRTITIQSNGFGPESSIAIRDSNNDYGFLNSATIQTDAIRSNGHPGIINIRSSNNSDTVLNVDTVQADGHVRTSTIRSTTNVLNVRDQAGNEPATINASIVQADAHLRTPVIRCTEDTLNVRSNTDGNATVDANVIQADGHLITPTVRSTGNTLNVRSSVGGNATVDANVIQANNHLITPTVRSTGNTLEIKSNTNAAATLDVNALNSNNVTASMQVTTSTIRATTSGVNATINVRDSNNAHGLLNSAIVQTDEIRRTGAGGIINVRDSGGDITTLNVNAITSNNVTAPNYIRTATIQSNGNGEQATVNIRDSNNAHGLLNSAIVQTDEIRRRTNDGIINVRNFGGSNTTLNVATLQTGTIQRNAAGSGTINVRDSANTDNVTINASIFQTNNIVSKSNGTSVNFRDPSNNFISLNALNTPVAIATVVTGPSVNPDFPADLFASPNVAFVKQTGFIVAEGLERYPNESSGGTIRFRLANYSGDANYNKVVVMVYLMESNDIKTIQTKITPSTTSLAGPIPAYIQVKTLNAAGTAINKDCLFSIVVYRID